MKNKKWKIRLSSLAVSSIPLVTVLSCSSETSENFSSSWVKDSRRHLVTNSTFKEGNESIKWFGTLPYNRILPHTGLKDVDARLISYWTYDKLDGVASQDNFFIRLKQAKSINITYNDGEKIVEHIFNEDKPLTKIEKSAVENEKNVNSDKFQNLMNHASVKKIDFILRDNSYWINHKGKKTKYNIINKDFLRGFRMQLYAWMSPLRYKAADWDKALKSKSLSDFEKAFKNLTRKQYFKFSNIDLRYLFELAGLPSENAYGINSNGELVNTETIAPSDEKNKLSFVFEGKTEPSFFFNLLINDSNTSFAAVPSMYIDKRLKVDRYSLPKTNTLGSIGFYKYGRKYNKMLYAGAYYISKNTSTIIEVSKNMHYVIDSIREDKKSVLKHSTFITKGSLDTTSSLQTYNRFKNGVDYLISSKFYEKLLSSKKLDILKNYKDTVRKNYYLSITERQHSLSWPMFPILGKKSSDFNQYYNDNFRKVLFGKSKDEMLDKNGNVFIDHNNSQELFEHLFTKGAVFKSLIHGAINWEQYVSINFSGKGQYWPLNIAPGGIIYASTGEKTALNIYTKNQKFTNLKMIKWDDGLKKVVSFGELEGKRNFDKISKISNSKEVWKSYKFSEIEIELKKLLDSIFGTSSEDTIEIEFPLQVRSEVMTNADQISYKNIADTLESLDLGRYKIKIKEQPGKSREKYIPNFAAWVQAVYYGKGSGDWNGWGADFPGALGNWIGSVRIYTFRGAGFVHYLSWMAKQDKNSEIVKTYPEFKNVADYYSGKYNSLVNSENFKNEIKNIINENKTNNKDDYSWNQIKNKVTKAFEDIVSTREFAKISRKSITWSEMVLGDSYSEKESEINKIIDDVVAFYFQKWCIAIQRTVLNNDESRIKAFLDETTLLQGISMQIGGTSVNRIFGKSAAKIDIYKEWLKTTQKRGDFDHIAEWQIEEK